MELPYRADDPVMLSLGDLKTRFQVSRTIATHLRARLSISLADWEVVIDIPEAVSFESDIPVETSLGLVPYLDAGTVFTEGVVRDFTTSLRTMRVMAPVDPERLTAADRGLLLDNLRSRAPDRGA